MTIVEFHDKVNACQIGVPYVGMFEADAEEAYQFASFPHALKAKIHYFAYEHGHSGGYSEIANHYVDVVDIARFAYYHPK